MAPLIGAAKLGGSVYDLPPGQAVCPYHWERPNEEWVVVLSGRPTLRHPEGEDELAPGDVVCFPEGPEGAHQLANRGGDPVRILMLSTMVEPALAVYPDSGKAGIIHRDSGFRLFVREDARVDYYDGEI